MNIASNVVRQNVLREVQSKTLELLSNALEKSFGPYGSNTELVKENAMNTYTKDGYTILKSINLGGIIEMAIKNDIEDIARHVAKTVGDGTTSAVLLSNIIFKELIQHEDIDVCPSDIVEGFRNAVEKIKKGIKERASEATPEHMARIALISSNNNTRIADNIYRIYKDYGINVYIDYSASTGTDDLIKEYDGITLEEGFADPAFVTDRAKNISQIRNPRIYIFEDPVDTPEMVGFFDTIINQNILVPASNQNMHNPAAGEDREIRPTVIITPKFSRDMSTFFDMIVKFMTENKTNIPLLVVTNVMYKDHLLDVAKLCGCPTIKKYIDPELQKKDVEAGLAPTPDTVANFYGTAELVESDSTATKFINPQNYRDENGEYSEMFKMMVDFFETELKKAREEGATDGEIGVLKRRLNHLKGNLVEYIVGGISQSDRDATLHLVEDAVLNCRSAALNGVGYGANFEAYKVSNNLMKDDPDPYIEMIHNAYCEVISKLYSSVKNIEIERGIPEAFLEEGQPMNIRTMQYNNTVLSSIESDIVILDAIAKIMSIMVTCNQVIVPTPIHPYYDDRDVE